MKALYAAVAAGSLETVALKVHLRPSVVTRRGLTEERSVLEFIAE